MRLRPTQGGTSTNLVGIVSRTAKKHESYTFSITREGA